MAPQLVASTLFARKGRLSIAQMGRLLVRGGGQQVDDALLRFGVDGNEATLVTVATVDILSGAIKGMRYETRGALDEIKFKAQELWAGAEAGVTIKVNMGDLSVIIWQTQGSFRNQSHWLEDDDLEVQVVKGDGTEMGAEEKEAAGIKGFCIRFTVQQMTVDKAILNCGIVPFGKEELRVKVGESGNELSSPLIPTISIKLYCQKGKLQNGRPVRFVPVEEAKEAVGLGHLPFIEVIGPGAVKFPDHADLEREQIELLRGQAATNNVSAERLVEFFGTPEAFPTSSTGRIAFLWPAYMAREEATVGQEAAEPSGRCL
jgi:hypothetical protein